MICPSDTPEGESCGLVKNLAITCHISTQGDDSEIMKILYDLGMEPIILFTGDELFDPNT